MTPIFLTHTPEMLANYYGDRALAALRELGDVRVNATGAALDDPDALARAAGNARIVVADRQTPVSTAFLDRVPDLLAVCRVAVDIRNIDVDAASRNGILVTRATPGFVDSVAELTIGFMVDLARGITRASIAYRAGLSPEIRPGRQLSGSALGVIGYGAIGRRICVLARAFGMTVLVSDPFATEVDAACRHVPLPVLLATSDFVVCAAIANEETENLMDAAAFAAMRADAFFINISRGNLVDEPALEAALRSGHLGGAAMDVGRAPDQMPTSRLAGLSHVIATPHVGGLTPQAAEHQAMDTVGQVAALVAGHVPDGAVNATFATRLGRFSGHP